MIVAIASGKGGTGKTTVAVSLALALAKGSQAEVSVHSRPLLVDCDVEAPNARLFLPFQPERHRNVIQPLPEVDERSCDFCGRCAEVCAFHAIAVVSDQVLVFPELCHGCGGCALFCPEGAITEVEREIGVVTKPNSPLSLKKARVDSLWINMPLISSELDGCNSLITS